MDKRCSDERESSYGVAGSRLAEFRGYHARPEIVDVVTEKCAKTHRLV